MCLSCIQVLEAIASKLEEKLQQTVASDKAVESRVLSDWEQLIQLKVDVNHAWIYLIQNPKGRGWGITLYDWDYPMQLPKGSRCNIPLRGNMPVLCQAQMVPARQRYPWDFDRCYVAMDGSTVAFMIQPGCDCMVVYPAPKVNNLQPCSIDMESHGRCLVAHGSTDGVGRRVVPVLMESCGRPADKMMEVIDIARVVQVLRVNGNNYSQG